MDLETRKRLFVEEFLRLQNEEIVCALEDLLLAKKAELFEKCFPPMTVEQYKAAAEKGMEDYRNGRFYTIAEARAKSEEWKYRDSPTDISE